MDCHVCKDAGETVPGTGTHGLCEKHEAAISALPDIRTLTGGRDPNEVLDVFMVVPPTDSDEGETQ